MLITAVTWALVVLSTLSFAVLLLRIVFVPLALGHEFADRRRRRTGRDGVLPDAPSVAVVVPAYNEEAVLASCVNSILVSGYADLEVVIVDDGSTDATERIGSELAADERVTYLRQENAGKGAALNRGYAATDAEILLFVDADSVFTPDTLPEMLRAFRSPDIGAVCGDDRPVNLNSVLTRFLAFITYVGTGLVRRAFDVLHCVPVISGNSGAFRREALETVRGEQGPFREDTIGEDLELTWRLHRSQWRVAFAPHAVVLAESPSNLKALWKQRVRWARGLLQGLRHHHSGLWNLSYPVFTAFLYFTVVTMVAFPVLQVLIAAAVLGQVGTDLATSTPIDADLGLWSLLWGLGLILSTVLLLIAMAMSNSLKDLRHAWTLPLWPIYSFLISFTMLRALWLEARNRPNVWNKPNRTGVISQLETTSLRAIEAPKSPEAGEQLAPGTTLLKEREAAGRE